MQNIIKRLLILLAFFVATKSYSQVYYYSGGKKIILTKDTASFLINVDESNADQPFLNNLIKMDGIQAVENTNDKNVIKIKLSTTFKKDKIYSALKGNSKILHAWEAYNLDGTPFIPTGEILFKVKKGVSEKDVLSKLNLDSKLVVSSKKGFDISVYNVIDSSALFDISNLIYESSLVEWCHPNFFVPITTFTNDPLWAQQYYLRNTGQLGGVAGIDINVEGAWNLTMGANIRVAVIDEGVEDHEDLGGRVLNGFTPRDVNGNGRPIITGAHGEATAGIIAATQDNGIGISGIAPQSQIVPVNIFAGGETALDIANGINWAWNQGQADVLSNSWGYNTSSQNQPNFDAIIQAITNARTQGRNGRGSIVVFASGNNFGHGLDEVSFPANVNGVITVGSCNNSAPSGAIWYYSERGASMDLVAPSGDINLMGDLTTLDRMGNLGYEAGNYTSRFGGTSAACPQVSGIAALILSINPNLTETQVTNILQTTATDMGAAGFDNTFGFGRVNACAAVRQAFLSSSMSGDNNFCNTGTYTLNGVLPGANITWSISPSNSANLTATGNQVTVTPNWAAGQVTLTATLTNMCGTTSTQVQKQITIGVPDHLLDVLEYQGVMPVNDYYSQTSYSFGARATEPYPYYPYYTETSYQFAGTASYVWRIIKYDAYGGSVIYNLGTYGYGYNPDFYFDQAGEYDIVLDIINNSCAYHSRYFTRRITVQNWWGYYSVSPNPSSGNIKIAPNNNLVSKTNAKPLEVQAVEIVDKMGAVRHRQKFGSGLTSVNISVSALPNDVYTLRIFDGKSWHSQKIIIQH